MDVSPLNITVPVSVPTQVAVPAVVKAVKETDTDNQETGQDSESAEQGTSDTNARTGSPLQAKSIQQLTQEEQAEVQQLQQRDREVRTHEAAHKSAAGRFAQGGASFEYERGPDGQQYAVGGEVSIDTSRPEDPRQALIKAQIIQRAATAPAQPSAQDRAVASEAAQMIAEAQVAIQQEIQQKTEQDDTETESTEVSEDDRNTETASAPVTAYQQIQSGTQQRLVEPVNLIV